jgi:hypothetical protein
VLSSGFENLRPYVLEQALGVAWCTFPGGEALPGEYGRTFRFAKKSASARNRRVTQHYCAFSNANFFPASSGRLHPDLAPPDFVSRVLLKCIDSGVLKIA